MPKATKHLTTTTKAANPKRVIPLAKAIPVPVEFPILPQSDSEIRHSEDMIRRMQEMIPLLKQRNLDSALSLAIEAAAGRGKFVDYFAEIGRRFGGQIGMAKAKPDLRAIQGGKS